ncbi:metal-dependent transcriptional regulator [Tersicoccus phoenicis]|uniref:metal-dependent transcriptional regulator n=1 Tax=Tersicoccus phoenicis TaxID=554083 RepID=UPI0013566E75|nr:metal-dependent transcriptional regulator [Tersicoccus phoenicis]
MVRSRASKIVEDYLTSIWRAQEWGGTATTTELADVIGVTPSTVSSTLKKLARDGLISYEPYSTIELTEAGRTLAIPVLRRHRIIETYLHRRLGLSWDQVHREADVLEHAVSDLVLSRMDDELGRPERDPHGDPIPGADGSLPVDATVGLVDLARGQGGTVARISDRQPQILRYLRDRGITPDTVLTVTEVNTAAASLIVDRRAADSGIVVPVEVSTAAASAVRVQPGSVEADPVSG